MHFNWVGESPQISNLQTELNYLDWFKCYWIFTDSGGPPRGWQVGGLEWWWMWGCGGCAMHAHTHTYMHAHTCMLNMIKWMPPCQWPFAISIHVHACLCMHACACVWRHLWCPQIPSTHLPPPQRCREPKRPKFNKFWTNQDIPILFEDSLPLNIPEFI